MICLLLTTFFCAVSVQCYW